MHWQINAILYVGYFGFLTHGAAQAIWDPNQELSQKFSLAVAALVYSYGAVFNVSVLMESSNFIQFQRSHIPFIAYGEPCLDVLIRS